MHTSLHSLNASLQLSPGSAPCRRRGAAGAAGVQAEPARRHRAGARRRVHAAAAAGADRAGRQRLLAHLRHEQDAAGRQGEPWQHERTTHETEPCLVMVIPAAHAVPKHPRGVANRDCTLRHSHHVLAGCRCADSNLPFMLTANCRGGVDPRQVAVSAVRGAGRTGGLQLLTHCDAGCPLKCMAFTLSAGEGGLRGAGITAPPMSTSLQR